MRTFRFNKLVRDKIVEQKLQDGEQADYRVLAEAEYLQALKAKILEEAAELPDDPEALLKELADLQEVIDCILQAIRKSKKDLTMAQAAKRAKGGSFKKRIFINTVGVPETSPWFTYYLENADRYPEVEA